ncbi:MAG: FkbM family methyltransferase [Bacteroidetes bacterium]|nr:FkbM family methyltransferase [Bacteroidota bacterium]
MSTKNLEKRLEKIERLARGNVLSRLLNNPMRYADAISYWRLFYPFTKRGRYANARTFFDADMQVVLPSATEIYLFGAKTHDSEIRLARFLMKNLNPGNTFCDIGAHFGYFSLLASKLVGEAGYVLSFEASLSTFGILKKNTAPYQNVLPLHRAASNEAKNLVFNEFPPLFSEYNSLILPKIENAAWLKNNPPQRVEVAGIRLDDYFDEKKTKPEIVKIDVEGAEPQVLQGMSKFLLENSPIVVMEYLISSSQNEAHRKSIDIAKGLGFKVFRIENDGSLMSCSDVEANMNELGLDSDNIVLKK